LQRHSWVLAVVAVLGSGSAAAAPDEITLATIIRHDRSVPDPALRMTCGLAPTGWSRGVGPARFTVSTAGTIAVDESAPPDTVAFTETKHAIAVLERRGAGALACGRIADGTYKLPSGTNPKDLLSLRVFDTIDDAAKQRVRAFRRDKVAELQKREREALHAEPELRGFAAAARAAVLTPSDDLIRRLDAAADQLEAQLVQLHAVLDCDADVPNGLLAPAVCADAFSIGYLATSIRQALDDVRGKATADQVRELRAAKVSEAITALGAEQLPVVVDEGAHCDALDELNWLSVTDMPRLVNRSQLPIADVVYGATYGVERDPIEDLVPRGRSFALAVSSVPVGEKTAFRARQGERTSLDAMTLAAAFFRVTWATSWPATKNFAARRRSQGQLKAKLDGIEAKMVQNKEALDRLLGPDDVSDDDKRVKFTLDVEAATLVRDKQETQKELASVSVVLDEAASLRSVATPSLICHRDNIAPNNNEWHRFRVDAALPPATGIENVAHVIKEVKTDHELSVVLCNGACGAAADEKTDRARLSITPSTRYSFTLLAELAGGVAFDGGFAGLSPPEPVPVLGADGPDQVFEIAQTPDPRNVFSTSLLLAYRLPHRFVVGLGPTLLVGTSGAVFQQWNARVGVKLGRGIYLTLGPSVRAMQFLNDYDIGDRISVARPASSAPTLAKHYEAVWEGQLGFSFDLQEVGGVGSDIYKALGGK